MSDIFYDGDFTVPTATSGISTSQPLAIQPDVLVYKQTFVQLRAKFVPLPLNAAPVDSGMTPAAPVAAGGWVVAGGRGAGNYGVFLRSGSGAIPNGATFKFNDHSTVYTAAADLDLGTGFLATTAPLLNTEADGVAIVPVQNIFLVEETERQDLGAGLVQWDRVWASKPNSYVNTMSYVYPAQRAQVLTIDYTGYYDANHNFHGTLLSILDLSEHAEPLAATVTYDYYIGYAAAQAAFKSPRRYVKATQLTQYGYTQDVLLTLGSNPQPFSYNGQNVFYAEPSDVSIWMGDIWAVKNVLVPSTVQGDFTNGIALGFHNTP